MALVARPAFAKSPWSLIDDQPIDVLAAMNGGDSFAATPRLGCFLLPHPLPQRVAVLHGLHSRLISPPARRREGLSRHCGRDRGPSGRRGTSTAGSAVAARPAGARTSSRFCSTPTSATPH